MPAFSYDLHIHSCLSPCGDNDMTPANIVGMAALKELDIIAVTDHNSCKNCQAAINAGNNLGILVVPGMELTTEEEVHVVCLFPCIDDALLFDSYIYKHILPIQNNREVFGDQFIVDEADNVTGSIDKLLISATDISFIEANDLVLSYNGICIPAHVDKSSNSLLSNLGFIPEGSHFKCFECKNLLNLHRVRRENPYLEGCKVITDSDAHYLGDINEAVNTLFLREKSIEALFEYLNTVT